MADGIPGHIQCVVFDFAGTLCSGHYFTPLGEVHEKAISKLIFGEKFITVDRSVDGGKGYRPGDRRVFGRAFAVVGLGDPRRSA